MNKKTTFLRNAQLAVAFAFAFFLIMLIGMLLVFAAFYLLARIGLLVDLRDSRNPLITFAFTSLITGTAIAATFNYYPLQPIRKLIRAIDRIADGDYSVRLTLKGLSEFRSLGEKFNHMAEELGSVEMLRNDFVNNFSHEFKTPIVSIRGFARILKENDLSPEERNEYLDIIIQESERLSDLSANVLNLSRIEQQAILTDKEDFNLSEQLRLAVALLDSRWPDKHMDFRFDADGIRYTGNAEMLSQVWINLLDNAAKFSPDGGTVAIWATDSPGAISISVANQGPAIPPETAAHIFDKFYQGDLSHATRGNGLGLTLARKIVELHGGTLTLSSSDGEWNVFTVELPDPEA